CDARRNGSLFLIDGETFHLVAWSPEPSEKFRDFMERIRQPFPIERSYIVKHVFESKAVFHVRDATVEADSDYYRQDAAEFGYHSALGVPLLRGDAVIGVLSLIRPDVRPFSEREIALVRAFADQAAIAIDNTRLSTATRHALERQIAVSQVLEAMSQSTADVSIVFRTIVRSAVNLCLADNASIFRADGEVYRHVASATASGRFADEAAFERIATEAARQGRLVKERATVVGRVLLEKATVQIPDVRADPEYDNTRSLDFITALSGTPARTVLGVPIVKGAALVGIVIARRTEVSPFSPREIDVLETFARQAAVAVENVRLFNETKEALERQTATADILRAIAGSPTDLAPVLDAIATSVVRFCGATDAQVWIKRGDDLYTEAHSGDLPISNTPLAASADTVSGTAMLERRTIHIHDIESEAGDAFPLTRERFAALGQRALLVAPLLREGSAIGTIALRKRDPIPFTPNQIRLVEAFADQAVIAIENVRLFNETKEGLQRQTAISEILRVISKSPTDVQPVLDTIAESAARFCNADDAAVAIVRDDGEGTMLTATQGGTALPPQAFEFSHRSVTPRAIREARLFNVADMEELPEDEFGEGKAYAKDHGYRGFLAAPLLKGGRAIGAIQLRRTLPGAFGPREIKLVETFAAQAVIAIENTRLFNETKNALDQQTATADVLKAISRSAFDLTSVFDVVVENANRL
ncbi:MAG: GAF domain-containing protein, partial [Actinobacteria bacterium]